MSSMEKYQAKETVISTAMDDDTSVLLDIESRQYFSLNATGTLIWSELIAGKTKPEIVNLLSERFEIGSIDALSQVDSFLSRLTEAGLVCLIS